MSLDFETSKCNPPLPKDANDNSLREVLIFGSITTGIPDITEKNYKEVFARLHLAEKVYGAYRVRSAKKGPQPVYLKLSEVKRWIGLHTNVSTMTRAQFLKCFDRHLDYIIRQAEREEAEAAK